MRETLEIEGMSCDHCTSKVQKFVSEVSGVKSANVSLERQNVEVEFDAPATLEAIIEAIEDAGFEVKK